MKIAHALLSTVLFVSPLGARAVDRPAVLRCEALLHTTAARDAQRTIGQTFADGAAEPERILAYVGLSHAELIELLNTGTVRQGEIPLVANVVADHPAVIAWERRDPAVTLERARADLQERMAGDRAWATTIADQLEVLHPRDRVTPARFTNFLEHLRWESRLKGRARLAPSLRQIRTAAEDSMLPLTGRGFAPRLRTLARIHDVPWNSPLTSHAGTGRALIELLNDLPADAGVVVALGADALPKIHVRAGHFPSLEQLDASDVIEIEPASDVEFEFLDRVRLRAGITAPAHAAL